MKKIAKIRKQKKEKIWYYHEKNFVKKLLLFISYKIIDMYDTYKNGTTFNEYGLTMYAGRQGSGKTTGMVEYLEWIRKTYPNTIIVTNFGYKYQHYEMYDWEQFFSIRNGEQGVVFAIDEIQNEFSSQAWNKFPEGLLREITQQRKQKVKIVATSQVFTRVAKQIREQTFEVVECKTLAGRWTWLKAHDAEEYNHVIDNPDKKLDLKRLWRKNFIQDKHLRTLYDSYQKIEKMRNKDYIPIQDRLSSKEALNIRMTESK